LIGRKKNNRVKAKSQNAIATQERLVVDIDYDKLAAAIAKAMKADEQPEQEKPPEKIKKRETISRIWTMLFGEIPDTEDRMTTGMFALAMSAIFSSAWLVCLGFAAICIGAIILHVIQADWSTAILKASNFLYIILFGGLMVFSILFAAMFRSSSKEFQRSNDSGFVMNAFNAVVALAALVVSIVAIIISMK